MLRHCRGHVIFYRSKVEVALMREFAAAAATIGRKDLIAPSDC